MSPTQQCPRAKRRESPGRGKESGATLTAVTQPMCLGTVPGVTAEALQRDPEAEKSPSEVRPPSRLPGAGCRCLRPTFVYRVVFFDQALRWLQTFLPS